MENEAQTDHVAYRPILRLHIFDVDDFGSYIAWGAAPDEEVLLSVGELGKAEIGNHAFRASGVSEDKVLGFEVSMHYRLAVHFLQAAENRKDDSPGFVRSELVLGLDLVVQKSSLQQLHHYVERVVGFEDFEQPHAVFVVQAAHYLDFFEQALLPLLLAVGCLFREGLHCKVLA